MSTDLNAVKFAENPDQRCPCLLVLDVSYSMMQDDRIKMLNEGLEAFQRGLLQDNLAMKRIEVAIIAFGDNVRVVQDFISAAEFCPPILAASGSTPLGEAVKQGLDLLEARKQVYKQHHIQYYRPWLFLVTDGAPTDEWEAAAQAAYAADQSKKVAFFAVGVEGADMSVLGKFSPRMPIKLNGLHFKEMFLWLSSSMGTVANSKLDEQIPLASPAGWGSV